MVRTIECHGTIDENSYLIYGGETRHGFLVDPGAQPEKIKKAIQEEKMIPDGIVLTHCHFDHIGAVAPLQQEYGIPVHAHVYAVQYAAFVDWNLSRRFPPQITLSGLTYHQDGDVLETTDGSVRLQMIAAPGHTTDSVVYYDQAQKAAFVGDLLFEGGAYGNTAFPGGNFQKILESIRHILTMLPEETRLYSGHSGPTTPREEKAYYF